MLIHPRDPSLCQPKFRRSDCGIEIGGFEAPMSGAEISGSPSPR
jgi:hypothetical protein